MHPTSTSSVRRTARRPPCGPARIASPLTPAEARRLAARLRAVADPSRLRLLRFLAAQPKGEACVCHLLAPVRLSQPTVSHHLAVLMRAGFVTRERRGVWSWYRIVPGAFARLADSLG